MEPASLLVLVLGVAALGVAAIASWRWGGLPTRPEVGPDPDRATRRSIRSLAAVVAGGLAAGILVLGLGGRLMMRLLAITSDDAAQGRLTEAEEVVGEITFSGTMAFIAFTGVIGGLVGAYVYLFTRALLPCTAALAGAVIGLAGLVTFGITDPLDPDNPDFAILDPRWLAIAIIVVLGLLYGTTMAALAARLETALPLLQGRPRAATLGYLPLLFATATPFVLGSLVYIGGRSLARGRTRALVAGPGFRVAAGVSVSALCISAAMVLGLTAGDILEN